MLVDISRAEAQARAEDLHKRGYRATGTFTGEESDHYTVTSPSDREAKAVYTFDPVSGVHPPSIGWTGEVDDYLRDRVGESGTVLQELADLDSEWQTPARSGAIGGVA